MKALFIYASFVVLFLTASCSSLKNTPENIQKLTGKIQNKDFTIVAKYANPMRGRQIYLSTEYDLQITNDSVFAFLPYFGVAYVAPYDAMEGGIKFAEPVIDYTIKPNKKSDGWNIRLKVKAKEGIYDILMNVFNNGSATFTVSSYNRDNITFDGEVKNKVE